MEGDAVWCGVEWSGVVWSGVALLLPLTNIASLGEEKESHHNQQLDGAKRKDHRHWGREVLCIHTQPYTYIHTHSNTKPPHT